MFTNHETLRGQLDPHNTLLGITITTRSGAAEEGLTLCTIRNTVNRRALGMLEIERQHGEYALPTLRINDIDTSHAPTSLRPAIYFSAWFEMLLLAHTEERSLVSKDTGNTHEEVAAWQWLASRDAAEIVEPFRPLIVGAGAVYYSGTALALPPSLED